MNDDGDTILGLLFILGCLAWSWWEFDTQPFSNEITRYIQSKKCNSDNICKWHNGERFTYKVNLDNQFVTFWKTSDRTNLKKINDCVIADRKNWVCTDKIGVSSFKTGFIDGKFIIDNFGVANQTSTDWGRNVWKTHWWYKHIKD